MEILSGFLTISAKQNNLKKRDNVYKKDYSYEILGTGLMSAKPGEFCIFPAVWQVLI